MIEYIKCVSPVDTQAPLGFVGVEIAVEGAVRMTALSAQMGM